MTEPQARRIAEAAIAAFDARRDLQQTETRAADVRGARDQRHALSAAEAALDRAISETVQR
jgi:hypothetical protein